ncbi:O-antigen ligase family protein [Pseudonocardia sp.]|uniref:O-antigen ligase family protein n=1 Tax=Pseudonocardia sp. TaxID=60912 RepID=UPI003D0DF27E
MTTTSVRPPERPPAAPERPAPADTARSTPSTLSLAVQRNGGYLAALGVAMLVLAFTVGPQMALIVVGAIVAVAVVGAAVMIPTVALFLMVASEFANASGVIATPVSIYTALLGLCGMSVVVGLARKRYRDRVRPGWWIPAALLLAYLVTIVPSAAMSQDPASTTSALSDHLKDIVFVVIVSLLLQMSSKPWYTIVAILVPLAGISVLTALSEYVVGNSQTFGGFSTIQSNAGAGIAAARHSGPLPDPNFWGRFLILGLPFGLAFVHRALARRSRFELLFSAGATLAILLGLYLTQSRGTMLAAGLTIVVWLVAAGPRVRRRAFFLAPISLLILLLPGIGDRLLTLTQAVSSAPDYAADQSLTERSNIGEVAFGVFKANPLFGTGPGSFAHTMSQYAPLTNAGPTGDITATHNLYLELLSETGIVGMLGWSVLIVGMLVLGYLATTRLAGTFPDARGGRLTRGVGAAGIAAIVGFSAASLFLHLAYSRTFLLVCALIGFAYSVARTDRSLRRRMPARATAQARKGFFFAAAVTVATAAAATVVGATLVTVLGRDTYVATSELTLQATGAGYPGYAMDIRRRTAVLPAYASVIQGGAATQETTVVADPVRGVMTVRAVGDSPAEAIQRRDAVVVNAPKAISQQGLNAVYNVVTVSVQDVADERVVDGTTLRIVLLATAGEIALVLFLCGRIRSEERRRGVWLI